jgi:hypothetical protein
MNEAIKRVPETFNLSKRCRRLAWSRYRLGGVLRHLRCALRDRQWRWHGRGILRELFDAFASPVAETTPSDASRENKS